MRIPKAITVKLWSINRWLRWTGIRLCVSMESENVLIGLAWYGWSNPGNNNG